MMVKAAFMGSPEFAVASLAATARACDLRVVVTMPDRPAGRGRRLTAPPVKVEAERLGVPVLQPSTLRDGTATAALREHDLDVIVVVAFGRILPADVLDLPPLGCINVHASLLPRWRGAAPIQRAIQAGDRETGVTIMGMEATLDTGPIHRTVSTPVGPLETSGQLAERLAILGAGALEDFLSALPDVPPPAEQDDQLATHAPRLRKEEGEVQFTRSVADVINHVRAMDPWPGAFSGRAGEPIKLFGAAPGDERRPAESMPGEVVGVAADGLLVACIDGVVAIAEVQPAGGRRMRASDYARGRPFEPRERLE